ncbi:MAG: hypothetical protein ACKOTD_08705, partial [Phycisphaerales bacterium]
MLPRQVLHPRQDRAHHRVLAAQRAVRGLRRLWDAELERIEAMAKSGRTDEALKALDTACQSAMPAQRSQCSG